MAELSSLVPASKSACIRTDGRLRTLSSVCWMGSEMLSRHKSAGCDSDATSGSSSKSGSGSLPPKIRRLIGVVNTLFNLGRNGVLVGSGDELIGSGDELCAGSGDARSGFGIGLKTILSPGSTAR